MPCEEAAGFKDHFSGHAADYAAYRPGYPAALFVYVATLPRGHGLAWDCATGNGQAATGLAPYFARVIATDASPQQIGNARPHPRIDYRVAPAESSGLAAGAVDLVTVAQALHWFELDKFFREARRVLAPGGAIAAWTYNLARVDPEIDRLTDRLARQIVGAYWPPERRWVDEEYRTIPFPFAEVEPRRIEHEEDWDLGRLLLYFGTWSSCHRYAQETGRDPVKMIQDELAAAWGPPSTLRRIHWPIYMRASRPLDPA
ncbi:MAG TPA: class I SAM-dependent methyltransferase [Thermoanaerobaculia bacterium]|nr:class I SAM-dependent methyltransferase [Thermoanaerobaculia bacterium]